MALIVVFPGSQEEPAEYESNNLVYCVECHAEWDADDNVYTEFIFHKEDGLPVCLGQCKEDHTDYLYQLDVLEVIQKRAYA